jgi:hypothetical protein
MTDRLSHIKSSLGEFLPEDHFENDACTKPTIKAKLVTEIPGNADGIHGRFKAVVAAQRPPASSTR